MAFGGLLVEIDTIGFERIGLVLLLAGIAGLAFAVLLVLLDAAGGPGVRQAGTLGDAMRDVIDRIIAGHVLLL